MQLVIIMIRLIIHRSYYYLIISRFCKAFANYSTANIKLSKTQLSKMVQLEDFSLSSSTIDWSRKINVKDKWKITGKYRYFQVIG